MAITKELYQIIDRQTGKQIGGVYLDRQRARHRADKLDLAYGAIRYSVKTIYLDTAITSKQ